MGGDMKPLARKEVEAGRPIPWTAFDHNGQNLDRRGAHGNQR
jgi:hypothetical protein